MAQLQPDFVPPRAADAVGYRPVSALALAGFTIAALYAAAVTVLGSFGLYYGKPLTADLAIWTLVFPLAGAVLALIARQQIQRSEGTRTGLVLANIAWWLCLLFGLGYAAVYLGTYLAIQWQADAFTERWFQLLRGGKVNAAFLLTRPVAERQNQNPDDAEAMKARYNTPTHGERMASLNMFRNNEMIQAVAKGGSGLSVKSLGVHSWQYAGGGYQVEQTYRLTTADDVLEVIITVQSSEKNDVDERPWQVLWERCGIVRRDAAPPS